LTTPREAPEELVKPVLLVLLRAAASPEVTQKTSYCLSGLTTSVRVKQTGPSNFPVMVGFVAQGNFRPALTTSFWEIRMKKFFTIAKN